MEMIKNLIILTLLSFPVTGWCANLEYALDIKVNTLEQKITGRAQLKSDTDKNINLYVKNLRNLMVDGNGVAAPANGIIRVKVQSDGATMIAFEGFFADKGDNYIDKDHAFLNSEWYPRPDILADYDLSVTLDRKSVV